MEKKNKHVRVGFSTILWAVLAILLYAAPCGALTGSQTVPSGGTLDLGTAYDPNVGVDDGCVDVSGTLNMYQGAYVDWWINAYAGSTVNIYGGNVGMYIFVTTDTPSPVVTVYGTEFEVDGVQYETPASVIIPYGTLTGKYEDGSDINLLFMSDIPINLAAPGEPSENQPPVANAGDDVTILSNELAFTVIQGTATDPDGDALQYRWLEGTVEFTLWLDVSENGEAPLGLGTILPEYLGVGTHILTLEVRDGKDTVSDDMVLTIEIAVNIEKAKVSWDHSDIHVYGKVYLPQGVWMDTLDRVGGVVTTLAGVEVANQSVAFEIKGKDGKKWEYKDKENIDGPIKEFKIDWKGAKFDYKGDEGLHIHTHHIGGTETTLCIHCDHISGAFTVSVNGTTIAYDEEKSITTGVEYELQKDNNTHVHFTLPFQLSPDMTIEVSGAIEPTINVADYYEEGFVKFKLISVFNPDSSWESSDELKCVISLGIGDDMISGNDLIDAWTKKDDKHWDYK